MGCNNSKEALVGGGAAAGGGGTSKEDTIELHISGKKEFTRKQKMGNVIQKVDLDNAETLKYPKSAEQENVIKATIESPEAFFFTGIGTAEKAMLISAMKPMEKKAGDIVIQEGDPGDFFYVVESGTFSAFVGGKEVKKYGAKTFFGELALAYNKPRAATVKCNTAGKVLALAANDFRKIISQSSKNRYDLVLSALKNCKILWDAANPAQSNITESQLAQVAEIVDIVPYKKDTQIIHKGETGKVFYMIKEGSVVVKNKGSASGGAAANVNLADTTLGAGSYFGELSLMRDAPRAADVIAKTDCVLLCLDRETFLSVLGPLQEVIDHNANMRLLDSVFMFQILTKREKKAIYEAFEVESHNAGSTIIQEGDSGNKFYIIKEGETVVKKGGKKLVNQQTGQVIKSYKGAYFGETALMEETPREATIEAVTDCELLTLNRKQFSKLVSIKEVHQKLEELKNEHKKQIASTNGMTGIKFEDLKNITTLGSGTFGRVTLVEDKNTKKVYALKAMLKSEIVAHKQQDNVMNEKNCMLACNYPFILRLHQTFKDSQKLYMLLEFIQGGELFSVIHPAHPPSGLDNGLSNDHAKFYSAGVFLAIAYLHDQRNIAYRDMKPENCLVDSLGYPKLVDFGFAKVITSKSYTLCGTPEYLAPELVLGRGHNKTVDHWAFGIMVYEMQTGFSPFCDHVNMDQVVICKNIVKGKLEFPSNFNADCKQLVKGLLNRTVKDRLGNLKGGTEDIKSHKWFDGYDWKGYNARKLKAPMVPRVKDPKDTSHFDQFDHDDHVIDKSYRDVGNWDKDF